MSCARLSKLCGRQLIGRGAINKAGDLCADLGFEGNAVLINDEITWKIVGKRLKEVLKEYGFRKVETSMVEGAKKSHEERASWREIEKGAGLVRRVKPSVVFGVGGGVNMDLSRAVAFRGMIPFVTVPTIFATDAQTMPWGAYYNMSDDYRASLSTNYPPIGVIADTEIVIKSPWRFQASGFGDYLAKVSAIADWKLAHKREKEPIYNEFVIGLMNGGIETLMKNAAAIRRKEEADFNTFMQIMINDGFLVSLIGPETGAAWHTVAGSEHSVANEISLLAPSTSLHGEHVALGTILILGLHGGDWKRVRNAMEEMGTPVTAKQIEVSDGNLVKALVTASKKARVADPGRHYSILNEIPLTEKAAEKLAKKTEVI